MRNRSHSQVLSHGPLEQKAVLRHQSQPSPKCFQAHLSYVYSVNLDCAGREVYDAEECLEKRALPCPSPAHNPNLHVERKSATAMTTEVQASAYLFTGIDSKAHPLKHGRESRAI